MPPSLDLQLTAAADTRRPISLRLSLASWVVQGGPALLVLAVAAYLHPIPTAVAVVIGVPFALVMTARRLDVDTEGLTLVPLLPFLRRQRFAFAELGRLHGGPGKRLKGVRFGFMTANLLGGRTYRRSWLYRSEQLKVPALYGASTWAGALTAEELAELVQAYRSPASVADRGADDALRRFESAPGTSVDA